MFVNSDKPFPTLLFAVAIACIAVGCQNHRERLVEDFSGHDFKKLELEQRLENHDEYSGSGYFASSYNIDIDDVHALEKLLPDKADASFFARTEMSSLLEIGIHYRYKMRLDPNELSILLLDRDRQRIIFYHSRSGR